MGMDSLKSLNLNTGIEQKAQLKIPGDARWA